MLVLLPLTMLLFHMNFGLTYLISNQWKSINIIIKSNIDQTYKMKVRKIIFKNYYAYTINKSKEFILKNQNLLYNLNKQELINCALLGLNNACSKYSGYGNFKKYLDLNVKGALYKGISEMKPISKIPHYLRKNKKWRSENLEYYLKNINNIQYLGLNHFIYDEYYNNNINNNNIKNNIMNNSKLQIIKDIINKEPAHIKRIFYYRYDEKSLNIIRNLKTVAELSCYSEEKIRLIINGIKKQLFLN